MTRFPQIPFFYFLLLAASPHSHIVVDATHLHLRLKETTGIDAVSEAANRASGLGPGAGKYLTTEDIADLSGRRVMVTIRYTHSETMLLSG